MEPPKSIRKMPSIINLQGDEQKHNRISNDRDGGDGEEGQGQGWVERG